MSGPNTRTLTLDRLAASRRLHAFYVLTKPRVNTLIVFCAIIGMFLAVPAGLPDAARVLSATLGIAFVAGAAAAFNCMIESRIDAHMSRTRGRPLPRGELGNGETLVFAGVLGACGLVILHQFVNPLTMWLTLATFVGYAVIYTVVLKPRTPQNIVIGGASGAMPPVLGWAAVTGEVSADALLLFLIIFAWTPPHFWALALYRAGDYAKAGVPMLPVVAGERETRRQILIYTILLAPVALAPAYIGLSGPVYGAAAAALSAGFLAHAWRVVVDRRDLAAKRMFGFSIAYLFGLFAMLVVDRALGLGW